MIIGAVPQAESAISFKKDAVESTNVNNLNTLQMQRPDMATDMSHPRSCMYFVVIRRSS